MTPEEMHLAIRAEIVNLLTAIVAPGGLKYERKEYPMDRIEVSVENILVTTGVIEHPEGAEA